jgi:ATP-binding cassette subfamily F protein 3
VEKTQQSTIQEKKTVAIQEIKASKETYLEKKEWDKQMRKAASQVEEVEERIARIERELETTEHLLAVPEHLDVGEIENMSAHYQQLQASLDDAMTQWELLTAELDELKNRS